MRILVSTAGAIDAGQGGLCLLSTASKSVLELTQGACFSSLKTYLEIQYYRSTK